MAIKSKKAGDYGDIVGAYDKKGGLYQAVAAIFDKSSGVYSNVLGPSAATIPGQVTGLTMGSVTSTTQAMSFAAPPDGGSAITDYVVQYSLTGQNAWQTFADGTSTTTSATVTGLTASTGYDYRVAAVNAVGQGAWSAVVYGATPSAAAVLPQSGNIVFNLKADSLALSDGATVSTWTDSTANALTFTGTGTFKANQLGGKPCVRFDGTAGKYMTAARSGTALDAAITTQAHTTVVVGKLNGTASLGCMFGATAGGNSYFMVADGAANSANIGRYAAGTGYCAPGVNGNNLFVSGVAATNVTQPSGATGAERFFLNGSCVNSAAARAPVTSANFSVGGTAAGGLLAKVDIFDIVVWDRTLTPTEMFQVTKYFHDKYSQTYPWAAGNNIYIFDGDSITIGVGSTNTAGTYPYKSAQSLGLAYGQWTNLGVGGIATPASTAKISEWSGIGAALSKNMRVAFFEYYNQRGSAASVIEANNNAYAAAVRALPNTKLALGTSTSSSSDSGPDATRVAINSYYDANYASYCDAYVPLHNSAEIGTTTAYATNGGGNGLNLFYDVVHLKDAGNGYLSAMFTTGLQSIP